MTRKPGEMDRRRLLGLGAAIPGLAMGSCGSREERAAEAARAAPPPMRYRPLGRTGLQVSEIAFGAHGVDNAPLMRAALDAGINTFCTSGSYLDGREEKALGEALRALGAKRDKIVVFTGEEVPAEHQRTARCSTPSTPACGDSAPTTSTSSTRPRSTRWPSCARAGLFEAIDEAKRAGKVRHLGSLLPRRRHAGRPQRRHRRRRGSRCSSSSTTSCPTRTSTTILRRAAERGIGTVVFKTTAGNRQREIKDLEAGGLSFRQATLKWALANPDVASVAVTATSFRMIRESVEAVGAPLSAAEGRMMRRYARRDGGQVLPLLRHLSGRTALAASRSPT